MDEKKSLNLKVETVTSQLTNLYNAISPDDSDEIKRLSKYLDWQSTKNKLYIAEKQPLAIPQKIAKSTLSSWEYNQASEVLRNYYYLDERNPKDSLRYIKKSGNIPDKHLRLILDKLVLTPRAVVWVEFGFNIGNEFGGRHPAVIIKNFKGTYYVLPLSTKRKEDKLAIGHQIQIDAVYGFSKGLKRYIDVTRLMPISHHRIDLASSIGSVNRATFTEIKQGLLKSLN